MKKILLIDDSPLMRRVISDIINATNEYCVAYTAINGLEGLTILREHDDILAVLCDINMPGMDGISLLRIAKDEGMRPPFIMCSSSNDAQDTIAALEFGAIEFIKKPENIYRHGQFFDSRVLRALQAAEEVYNKTGVQQRTVTYSEAVSPLRVPKKEPVKQVQERLRVTSSKANKNGHSKLVALVCSTGGPRALQYVIPKLPKNLAAPVLIVQHMPVGFTASLAARMNELSEIRVKEAEEGERITNGVCYIAKGGTHLAVTTEPGVTKIKFDDTPPIVGLKPCGNIMYNSLHDVSYDEIVCVVLTGMGADGTKGIQELSKHKPIYVIAQDEKSSTVYGMPKAIYESGLTDCVCDINKIAEEIVKKVGVL